MKLQRQYTDGACTHVEVVHTGAGAEQNFSERLVAEAVAQGWITLADGYLYLSAAGEAQPLRYTIKRAPGYHCKSSAEQIPVPERAWLRFTLAGDSSQSRAAVLAWLAAHGKAADDYEISTTYQCVLDSAQHARLRGVRNRAGNVVAAHTIKE